MYALGWCKFKCFISHLAFLHFTFHWYLHGSTVAIKNIRNMHAVSTNQTADILHFNDKNKIDELENMRRGNMHCNSFWQL